MDDVSQELKAFLDYINGKKSNDPYVKELDERIRLLSEALKSGVKAEKLAEMFKIPLGEIREVELKVLQKEL